MGAIVWLGRKVDNEWITVIIALLERIFINNEQKTARCDEEYDLIFLSEISEKQSMGLTSFPFLIHWTDIS
jgi:hypothetical protein